MFDDPNAGPPPPRTPLQRALALVALLALLASGAWSSWLILTDRADFRALVRDRPAPEADAEKR